MNLSEILIELYSDNKNSVYNILNKSCYVTDKKFDADSLFLHTGFKFVNHNKTIFFIYIHIDTLTIVRSPSINNPLYENVPQILGLPCVINQSGYINNIDILGCFFTKIIINSNLSEKDRESFAMNKFTEDDYKNFKLNDNELILTDADEKYIYKNFEIISNGALTKKLPLHKTFRDIVFQNGNHLKEYDITKFEKRENLQTAEEWFKSEFGNDASTAWWNTH